MPREDDVFVCTSPKAGTTWMQTIVALLISGDPDIAPELAVNCPWIDIRSSEIEDVLARLEAQTERRSLKSHTPLDGIPLFEACAYLCVFRHPLDVHFSLRRHVANMPLRLFDWYFPEDDDLTYKRFLMGAAEGSDYDATPLAAIVHYYKAARAAAAERANVHLFHYADMTRDLAGTMARVADIMGVTHPPATMQALIKTASFETMSADGARFAPGGGRGFWKSDDAFFDSGSSGKWTGHLSDAQLAQYEAAISDLLSPEDRRWLEYGSA